MAKTLERLVKSGRLMRVARGIYIRPAVDPIIGPITPSLDTIAKAIARRDRARIVPTGLYALNRLGLSTQVPVNVVYLTDGAGRKLMILNRTITFKKTTPKNVATTGEISGLVIQALKTIGKSKISPEEIRHLQGQLARERATHLKHDLKLAPVWIKQIMLPVLNRQHHEEI